MWDLDGVSENDEIIRAALDVKFIASNLSCVSCLEIRAVICFTMCFSKRFHLHQMIVFHNASEKWVMLCNSEALIRVFLFYFSPKGNYLYSEKETTAWHSHQLSTCHDQVFVR